MLHAKLARAAAGALVAAGLMFGTAAAEAQGMVRVALGDVVSVETLAFLIALERAKERGLDYELTSFAEEELAIQAIVGGQADVGVGTPYAVIQKTKVPLRILFQVSSLVFYPVVSVEYETWADLDGEPFTFHGRGSGTEAIGNIIAAREGIEFGQRNYVPGSDNRVIALLNGTIKATILDLANKNVIMAEAPDRFHLLPTPEERASDEVVFASQAWIAENQDAANILVEELLKLWSEMTENPAIIEEERAARGLLADQPAEILAEVTSYYTEGAEAGLFDPDGGGEDAARLDFDFYTQAGQLEGTADALVVEDYWDLAPLTAARQAAGG
jgi:NitT/TauT family transport system substrate-binding protein